MQKPYRGRLTCPARGRRRIRAPRLIARAGTGVAAGASPGASAATSAPDYRKDPWSFHLRDPCRVSTTTESTSTSAFPTPNRPSAPCGGSRPSPHAPWTQTLKATQFGPTCAQITTLGVFAGPANANEDCLYLNVFTPKVDAPGALPVLVWIHGGGNVDGESNDYDGSKLASQGQTVVVTLNYRLGLLGWLANPALDSEGHPFGNYGLLDQQLVLKWVQNNIASFGGDPNRVALGGQSAGSVDTSANVASPLAVGLFSRAIFESALADTRPLASAEQLGTAFSVAAGCGSGADPTVAACMRSLSAQTIMNLQGTASANGPYVTNIIADGTILPTQGLFSALRNGNFTHMPIMSGWVHDEENFSLAIQEYFSGPRKCRFPKRT